MQKLSAKRKKSGAKKFFLFLKLSLCICVICTAVYLKYSKAPVLQEISQTVNRDFKIDEAVAVISNEKTLDEETMEVFEEEKEMV